MQLLTIRVIPLMLIDHQKTLQFVTISATTEVNCDYSTIGVSGCGRIAVFSNISVGYLSACFNSAFSGGSANRFYFLTMGGI